MARKRKSSGNFLIGVLIAGGFVLLGWLVWKSGKMPASQISQSTSVGSNQPAQSAAEPQSQSPAEQPASSAVSNAPANQAAAPEPLVIEPPFQPRAATNYFEAQLALDRRGFSPGCIDGRLGAQTAAALRAFQFVQKLSITGELDAETRSKLLLEAQPWRNLTVTEADLGRLRDVPSTWLGKSQMDRLDYGSILEMAAEKGHATLSFIRGLNPSISWTNISPGTSLLIPNAERRGLRKAAFIRIELAAKVIRVYDSATNLIAFFPCSIARRVDKRPIGKLTVVKVAENPNYVFDPEIFPESAEGRALKRKLVIPPGPNNPVGVAWIGLDRSGYGIHGTPSPEQIGRSESHGCFRLANWNAETLLKMSWIGMPVYVDP